jgi:hypothetical protein
MTSRQGVQRMSPNRTHHYIDIENLAGCGRLTAEAAARVRTDWDLAVVAGERDLFTIGCDTANVLEAGRVFPGARIVCGHGPDGADLALIQAMDADMAAGPGSSRVTLGSGDHIFASPLAKLARRGVQTRVVGIRGHTSARLRIAAHHTTLLTETTDERIAA